MTDFIAGKLGEVLAFARIGLDTMGRGEEALLRMLNKNKLNETKRELRSLAQKIEAIAKDEGVLDAAEEQAEITTDKVTAMRDTYLGDAWDEESEVLEWMGFYTGASLVHWHLIAGAAGKPGSGTLSDVSREALGFYNSFFAADERELQAIGAKAAAS